MIDQGPDHASGLRAVAERYGVGLDAVRHLIQALERGRGSQAQFNHPELGGMGQWSSGGMVMIGDMFNDNLKVRVAGLCTELAAALPPGGWVSEGASEGRRGGGEWWPAGLGAPASAGAQDGMRYAYFPDSRRLAVETGDGIALYDTGEHRISGVSQSNGSLGFTGQFGTVDLGRLQRVGTEGQAPDSHPEPRREATASFQGAPSPQAAPASQIAPASQAAPTHGGAILDTLERLAGMHARGVLTEQEFAQKKAELLARL